MVKGCPIVVFNNPSQAVLKNVQEMFSTLPRIIVCKSLKDLMNLSTKNNTYQWFVIGYSKDISPDDFAHFVVEKLKPEWRDDDMHDVAILGGRGKEIRQVVDRYLKKK